MRRPAGLDDTNFDIYLKRQPFSCKVPAAVWSAGSGDTRSPEKWLSYKGANSLAVSLRPKTSSISRMRRDGPERPSGQSIEIWSSSSES